MPNASLNGIEFTIKGSSDSASNSVKKLINNVAQLSSAFKTLGNDVSKIGKLGLKGLQSSLTAPLKQATSGAVGFAKSLGGVLGAFKRILGYRIIRSIIKEITQAFSDGIKNLYGWSHAFGGAIMSGKTFADTMDSLATSSLYFKNSIGAAVAPLISALAPAIDFVIDKVVALINVINQLLSLLGGATSWNRAVKKAKEFGDAASGAGGAAKEALKYLAPFDELNRLPDENKGGGGGGGGTDYSGMFENVTEFNEGLKDFVDSVKDAFNRGDWESLGTILGEKVNELVEKVPWAEAGQKVGYYINGWFSTKYWTLETINFQNIGGKIAEFFNNAIEQINFNTIGRTITQKFTIIGDLIIGAIQNINWSNVGKSVGDFLRGAFDQVSEWLDKVDWVSVGTSIFNGLKDAITGVDFSSLAESVFTLLGSALGASVTLLSTVVGEVVEDIKGYFTQFIEDENGDGAFGGKEIINGIKKGMKNAIDGIGTWIKNNVIIPIANGFINNLGEPIANAINNMIDTINEYLANHPKIANFLGIDQIEHITLPVIPELTPDAKQFYKEEKKDLETASRKNPLEMTGNANLKTANTVEIDGTSVDAVADLTSTTKHFKNSTYNNNGTTPLIPSIAEFWDYQKNFGSGTYNNNKTTPVIASRANLTSYGKSFSSGTYNGNGTTPLIDSRANFKTRTDSSLNKTFDSTANFTKRSTDSLNTTIPTLANFTSRSTTSLNTSINTVANFTKYTKTFSDPSMNANAALVDPYWKYGTPTMTINAAVNNPGNVLGGYGYAEGGSYYGGDWHRIPQAAKGGQFHGTLFWAGEQGAEVVGHAGGRTEVLNRSQLASTMYSSVVAAVSRAMNGVGMQVSIPGGSLGADESANEDMIYRAMLRALNDSDFDDRPIELDGEVIYRNVVNRNKLERRRAGVNPMLAV